MRKINQYCGLFYFQDTNEAILGDVYLVMDYISGSIETYSKKTLPEKYHFVFDLAVDIGESKVLYKNNSSYKIEKVIKRVQ